MRDKNRIEPLLNDLRELWYQNPDLRLCQLINVVCVKSGWKNNDFFYLEDNIIAEQIRKELKEEKTMIGKKATVTKINDGLGNSRDDQKYISKAYNQIVKLISLVPDTADFYITDFFIPEYIKESNDYIHYGFLKVSRQNITLLGE